MMSVSPAVLVNDMPVRANDESLESLSFQSDDFVAFVRKIGKPLGCDNVRSVLS